jgi:hypothetical protein
MSVTTPPYLTFTRQWLTTVPTMMKTPLARKFQHKNMYCAQCCRCLELAHTCSLLDMPYQSAAWYCRTLLLSSSFFFFYSWEVPNLFFFSLNTFFICMLMIAIQRILQIKNTSNGTSRKPFTKGLCVSSRSLKTGAFLARASKSCGCNEIPSPS